MQITHGGFQGFMSHGLLDGARIGAPHQTVSCIGVTQLVRKNGKTKFLAGYFDGALEIGLVHAVADQSAGTRVKTRPMSWKQPGPGPAELKFWKLAGQLVGQHDWQPILAVPQPQGTGELDLLAQFGNQRRGNGQNTVLTAFGVADAQSATFEVNVFDAQIEGLGNAQAAAVQESGDKIGGVGALVGDGQQEGLGFRGGRCVADMGRTLGPERFNAGNGLAQNFFVKEQDGIEGLVLGTGGDIAVTGQAGEEVLDFLAAGEVRGHLPEGFDIMPQPMNIGVFSGVGFVLTAQDLTQFIDGLIDVHNEVEFDIRGGTKAVQGSGKAGKMLDVLLGKGQTRIEESESRLGRPRSVQRQVEQRLVRIFGVGFVDLEGLRKTGAAA